VFSIYLISGSIMLNTMFIYIELKNRWSLNGNEVFAYTVRTFIQCFKDFFIPMETEVKNILVVCLISVSSI